MPARPRRAKPAKPLKTSALPEWNLADLYPGLDAPEVKRDLDRVDADCLAFEEAYKGRLAELARAPFPKLVISGGHSPAFEAVCDVLADRTGAERAVLAGRGHTIPALGEPYNELVGNFLDRAEATHQSRN